ncbi:GNAT family N-acetyltransferase [Nocardia sp. NBC_00416]|uniref:GNAT family N-acetyltransferase n=1 Tax=Nocardia sp. NBC_00416 TaxID=2975991 RepID=UPI002E22CAF8
MLISDGVIGLRPIEVADAAAQPAAGDRESLRRAPGTRTPNIVAEFERYVAEWADDGPRKTFGVVDVVSRTLAGTLALALEQEFLRKRQADIEYGIYAPWRGRGIAGRSVILACRYLARHDLADEAVLRIDPDNMAAIALAHHLGFHFHHTAAGPDGKLDWFIQAV